jgi:hypothetical protein
MRVVRDRKRKMLKIDQQTYATTLLERFHMNDCNLTRTPSDKYKLSRNDEPITIEEGKKIDRSEYISMVGSLLYASTSTRPDFSYAVGVLSRFMHNPGSQHVVACKRVLRYLKGTTDLGLEYNLQNIKHNEFNIEAFTDADWAGDHDQRRSTTGWLIKLNGCTVSWSSKRQTTPALSTAEAEYMAVSAAVQEIQWIRQLIEEMTSFLPHTKLYCDNQAAIWISNDDTHHQRTKHIDIKHHHVRDALNRKQLELLKIATEYNVADILTKALDQPRFQRLRDPLMKALSVQHETKMDLNEQQTINLIYALTHCTEEEEQMLC